MWARISLLLPFLIPALARTRKMTEIDCDCGIKNHDTVTVLPWGKFAENHAWPWMASIVNLTLSHAPEAYCGATLINDRYVLTAAHCIPDMIDTGLGSFRIYVGTNYISNGSKFFELGIRKIISHPKFDFDTADNDICLIKLSAAVPFSDHVRPICLRQVGHPFVGEHAYITGWGSYNLTEPTQDSLKEAEAFIVGNDLCAQNYSSEDIPITENMICAALPDAADPCSGDSGGPLMVKEYDGQAYNQIGIISHGQGCLVPDFPSIFSRVSSYIGWIKENTWDGIYCAGTFSS